MPRAARSEARPARHSMPARSPRADGLRRAGAWRSLSVLMDFIGRIRLPRRAWVVLLAALVALCANLAGPAMVMADGQACVGLACETQIACSQPTHPQISSASSIELVTVSTAGERSHDPVQTKTFTIDPPPTRAPWKSLGPLASRAPPAV